MEKTQKPAVSRILALEMLLKTFGQDGYSNIVVRTMLEESGLTGNEKALCTRLYYGVIERLLTLEYLLEVYNTNKAKKIDAVVRYALYLGFYQLKYCDKIPDSAAVHESVQLVRHFRKKSAAGFVNAILRKFQRAGKVIPPAGDRMRNLEIQYSAPAAFIQKVTAQHGETFAERYFTDSFHAPACFVRKNCLKCSPAAVSGAEDMFSALCPVPCPTTAYAYQISAMDVSHSDAFQQGLFHVQDLASQLCCKVLHAQPGETVIDMCAAPGGKTFTIAEDMQNTGTVYAFDLHPHRVKLIQQGAERLGLTCVHTDVKNATEYDSTIPVADRVLCDVPCSGFGVIRRKPEIKYKSLDTVQDLPALQYQILENASRYVKPGGVLVYSTCTIFEEENQEVVQKFLTEHTDFTPTQLTELGITDSYTLLSAAYADCDGFFIAKLQRKAVR